MRWYLAAGGVDPYKAIPVADRWGYCVRPSDVAGFKTLDITGGAVEAQDMSGWPDGTWQDEDQLWWTGTKPGDKLDLAMPDQDQVFHPPAGRR